MATFYLSNHYPLKTIKGLPKRIINSTKNGSAKFSAHQKAGTKKPTLLGIGKAKQG
jgi:hypothetical protein